MNVGGAYNQGPIKMPTQTLFQLAGGLWKVLFVSILSFCLLIVCLGYQTSPPMAPRDLRLNLAPKASTLIQVSFIVFVCDYT